jgi:hypothetical protein
VRNLGWTWRVKSGSDQAERRYIMPFMGPKTSRGERSPEGVRSSMHPRHHVTPFRTLLTDGRGMALEVGSSHAPDAHMRDTHQTDHLCQTDYWTAPGEQNKVPAWQL